MTQGSTFYVYDAWGRRIWKQTGQTGANECEAHFYGAMGQKLESYSCAYTPNTIDWFTTLEGINTYFGGKMLSEKGVAVLTDRLGSVRANSNGKSFSYFPWGEERGTGTADGRTKFAGYYRDMPGQDYANVRYYSATTGTFWSPDPGGMKTGDATNPIRWNRYLYGSGDPINRIDPLGKEDCDPDDDEPCFETEVDDGGGDGGGTSGEDVGLDTTPQKAKKPKKPAKPQKPAQPAALPSEVCNPALLLPCPGHGKRPPMGRAVLRRDSRSRGAHPTFPLLMPPPTIL